MTRALEADSKQVDTMTQRYARALRASGPKAAAETPGLSFEGYWLDDQRFFFANEKIEPSLRRVVPVPSIADCVTQKVEEVIPLDVLAGLLSVQSGQQVELKALSCAEYDMPDHNRLAVSAGGHDYLVDLRQRCVISASPASPVAYSPDGRYACFVKNHDLWLTDRRSGAERALTMDGAPHCCYGQHSETSLTAVSYRKRPSPAGLWSPDSKWFLTHRIDERSLPELDLVQNAPPGGGRPALHRFKYPLPGNELPVATYVAVDVESGRVVTFSDCPMVVSAFSPFFLRRAWFSGADTAFTVRMDRYCRQADLIRLDLATGTSRIVLTEAVATGYIDLHPSLTGTPNVRTLPRSNEVVWYSERDGWGHLYLYNLSTGELKSQITRGTWLVRDLVHVDEVARKILFLASGLDSTVDRARRSLCVVNFDGSGFEVLLAHDGDVFLPKTEPAGLEQDRPFRLPYTQPGISPSGRFGVVRYASVDNGNVAKIVDLQNRRGFVISAAWPAADESPLRHFTVLAADGATRLHGVMYLPPNFTDGQRYPLIDYIYPGPQVAHQPQSFRTIKAAHAKSLGELGFITIMLDTRGLPIGSRDFHQVGYGTLLEPQLADHAAVIRQLAERHPFIDGERVGMIGISGGGSATARALCDYADVFKVGVAVCGNHDSSLYAAVWSDKYRGPSEPDKPSKDQPSSAVAHKLRGNLLLISGDMDENVHVSQTLAFVDALIKANRDFDLLIVPNAGHGVLTVNGYALRRTWDYFVCHLLGEKFPRDFQIQFEPYELHRLEKQWVRESRQ